MHRRSWQIAGIPAILRLQDVGKLCTPASTPQWHSLPRYWYQGRQCGVSDSCEIQ